MKNRKLPDTNKSGQIGVSWSEANQKWRTVIGVNLKNKHGGYFKDFKSAVKRRKELELEHGYSSRHGEK